MREIKFRIWDGHTKSFFDTPDTHYLPALKCDEKGILTIKVKDDSYVLMQLTGLLDKNGFDLYEGDLCLDADGREIEIGMGSAYVDYVKQPLTLIGNIWEGKKADGTSPTKEL